jgi:hypothetical protein
MMEDELDLPVVDMTVKIYKTDVLIDDDDTPQIIDLEPTGNPLNITVLDHDKDKFTPIRAKKATIRFKSEPGKDFSLFSDTYDNLWYVTIEADEATVFLGFLSLADMQQDFLPDPVEVVLTASDHLGMLRDIPLTDDDRFTLLGRHKIGHIIGYCLKKTGLSLAMRVVNNLRHGSGQINYQALFTTSGPYIAVTTVTDTGFFYEGQTITVTGTTFNNGTFHVTSATFLGGVTQVEVEETIFNEQVPGCAFEDASSANHLYEECYLDIKTFEEEINTSENCYDVLTKILGEQCYLFQFFGQWWIINVDELDGSNGGAHRIHVFSADGDDLGVISPSQLYNKDISRLGDVRPLSDRLIQADRPHGTVKLEYVYENPIETVPNINFERGDLNNTVSATEKRFNVDDWRLTKGYGASAVVPVVSAYIKRIYDARAYETQSYLVLTQSDATGSPDMLISNDVPVHEGDSFDLSFDVSAETDNNTASTASIRVASIVLFANSGSVWSLQDSPLRWEASDNNFLGLNSIEWALDPSNEDLTDWVSFSISAPSIPEDGNINLVFYAANQGGTAHDNFNIRYQNVSFEYIPLINGSYTSYRAQHQKVTRDPEDYLAKRENQVHVSEGQKLLHKGVLQRIKTWFEIFSGTCVFQTLDPGSFYITGFYGYLFQVGQKIKITNTSSNNITASITSVSYSIITGRTTITLDTPTAVETDTTTTISKAVWTRTEKFFPLNVFPNNRPDLDSCHPYSEIQIRAVWNQYRNANRIFSGSHLDVYDGSGDTFLWCDLMMRYLLLDTNQNTDNKIFLCTGFDQNWKTGVWRATFIEAYDNGVPKVYTDEREFKYLNE